MGDDSVAHVLGFPTRSITGYLSAMNTVPGPARFTVEHVHIYRISDGKMIEHWVVRDDLTMLRQLGAIPTRTS